MHYGLCYLSANRSETAGGISSCQCTASKDYNAGGRAAQAEAATHMAAAAAAKAEVERQLKLALEKCK
ncbi:MAG: hypothetical protein RH948_16710 [Cyclobacteriaceae bacterium]